MQALVQLTDVNLTYNQGKASEFKALKNINLEIYPEEFVIFFWPIWLGQVNLALSYCGS